MRNDPITLLTLILCLLPGFLLAQATITGQVQQAESEKPLPYASILLLDATDSTQVQGAVSKESGRFELNTRETGPLFVRVSIVGYATWTSESFILEADETRSFGTIALRSSARELEAVTIEGERSRVQIEMGKRTLYVGSDISSQGETALNALDQLPSVTTDLEGAINIRGESGVVIFINGQETNKDGLSLRNIPASRIKKIELITNPSASYAPEGVGGIINIIYKDNPDAGLRLNSNAMIGLPRRYEAGIDGSYATGPWEFALAANGGVRFSNGSSSLRRQSRDPDQNLQVYSYDEEETGQWKHMELSPTIRFSPDTSFSVSLMGELQYWRDDEEVSQISQFTYAEGPGQTYDLRNENYRSEKEFEFRFNLLKKFARPGQMLRISIDGSGEEEAGAQSNNLDDVPLADSPLEQFIEEEEESEFNAYYRGQIKYFHPLGNEWTAQIGLDGQYNPLDVLASYDFAAPDFTRPDNDYEATEKNLAGFLLFSRDGDRLKFEVGSRLEYFDREAAQQNPDTSFSSNYWSFFPTGQLSYALNEEGTHVIGISYSRRIDRVDSDDINPYLEYDDPYNLSIGNPDLNPVYSNQVEFNYEWSRPAFDWLLTAYYRDETNSIQDIVTDAGDQTIETYANFANEINRGLESVFSWNPTEWLAVDASALVFNRSFSSGGDEGNTTQRTSWRGRVQPTATIAEKWQVEMTGVYRSPQERPQFTYQEQFYVNFGMRYELAEDKGSVYLNARDIFGTRNRESIFLTPAYRTFQSRNWQFQTIQTGITWQIK